MLNKRYGPTSLSKNDLIIPIHKAFLFYKRKPFFFSLTTSHLFIDICFVISVMVGKTFRCPPICGAVSSGTRLQTINEIEQSGSEYVRQREVSHDTSPRKMRGYDAYGPRTVRLGDQTELLDTNSCKDTEIIKSPSYKRHTKIKSASSCERKEHRKIISFEESLRLLRSGSVCEAKAGGPVLNHEICRRYFGWIRQETRTDLQCNGRCMSRGCTRRKDCLSRGMDDYLIISRLDLRKRSETSAEVTTLI